MHKIINQYTKSDTEYSLFIWYVKQSLLNYYQCASIKNFILIRHLIYNILNHLTDQNKGKEID